MTDINDSITPVNRQREGRYRFILWLFVIVALCGTIFAMARMSTPDRKAAVETAPILASLTDKDWSKGNVQAKNVLVEYSDFQCPTCGIYFEWVKEIEKTLGKDLRIVYRHFPLPQHPNAEPSARAADAAGKQGKFWEMHDKLFANRDKIQADGKLPDTFYTGLAKEIGLDTAKFSTDFASKEVAEGVKASVAAGTAFKVNSTPTFYFNDKKLPFSNSLAIFKTTIENALKENQ